MISRILIVITSLLLMSSCSTKTPREIDYGQYIDGVYTNSYFGMSIELPTDWVVQSESSRQELLEKGRDLLAGDDKNLSVVMEASLKQTVVLFSITEYEVGSPVPSNPNINCAAERISSLPGIRNGSDYLYLTKKTLKAGQLEYDFSEDFYSETISGVEFDVMPMVMRSGNTTLYQKLYASKFNDYALLFVLSYFSEEEELALQDIMSTLRFSESES